MDGRIKGREAKTRSFAKFSNFFEKCRAKLFLGPPKSGQLLRVIQCTYSLFILTIY